MRIRPDTLLVAAAVFAVPVAFDPGAWRPFVGAKLVLLLGACVLVPAALTAAGGVSRIGRLGLAALGASALSIAVATVLSLVPAVSAAGGYARGMGLFTRLSLLGIALLAATSVASDRSTAIPILRAALAGCAICATMVLLQAMGADPFIDPAALTHTSRSGVVELRPVGTAGHANFAGQVLVLGVGIALALVRAEPTRVGRGVAAAVGVLVATGAVASGSRGAWLALGVQTAMLTVLWRQALFGSRRRVFLAALGLATVAAVFASGSLGEAVVRRAESFRADGLTGSGRTLLWRDALPMTARWAAHGCGPETFILAFQTIQSEELTRAEPYAQFDSAHNVLLDTVIATGVGGLVAFILLVAVCVRSALRSGEVEAGGLVVAVTGWLTAGMFIFDTMPAATVAFALLGICLGLAPRDGAARAPAAWRPVAAGVLAIVAIAGVWPRLRLVWLADRQMARAVASATEGRLDEAVPLARAAVVNGSACGPRPELRHLLARVLARAGDPAREPSPAEATLLREARAELDAAIPESTTPHLLLAEAADLELRFGNTDAAIGLLETACMRAPAFWAGRARLARLRAELGDLEGARRDNEAVRRLNPERAIPIP